MKLLQTCLKFVKYYSTDVIKSKLTSISKKSKKVLYNIETDSEKLCNFACGVNYLKGQPDVPLGKDSEYPDWLWKINLDKPKPIEELEPDTYYYWYRVRRLHKRRQNAYSKLYKPKG